MTDMHAAIIPKSDQLNSDNLIGRSITIKIKEVTIRPGTEQPVSIFYDGDEGKPYKACKSMCRVLVSAWGADSSKYVGRSMTLYSDPKVKWGGMEVGGIRISHMSDIDGPLTMALTVTRANKKPYTVKPIKKSEAARKAQMPDTETGKPLNNAASATVGNERPSEHLTPKDTRPAPASDLITDDEVISLESRCTENGINPDRLRKAAMVEKLANITTERLPNAHKWIDAAIAKQAV